MSPNIYVRGHFVRTLSSGHTDTPAPTHTYTNGHIPHTHRHTQTNTQAQQHSRQTALKGHKLKTSQTLVVRRPATQRQTRRRRRPISRRRLRPSRRQLGLPLHSAVSLRDWTAIVRRATPVQVHFVDTTQYITLDDDSVARPSVRRRKPTGDLSASADRRRDASRPVAVVSVGQRLRATTYGALTTSSLNRRTSSLSTDGQDALIDVSSCRSRVHSYTPTFCAALLDALSRTRLCRRSNDDRPLNAHP